MIDVNDFFDIRIGLATAKDIRAQSSGEVRKPETINYRTLKPEKEGLFCEEIFGPTKDWECYCGKYKRVRFKGIICEKCNVEVTRSKVRRERVGHIELAAPVVHIWYLRGTRSWLAYFLTGLDPKQELKAKALERVIYFAASLVTKVDSEKLQADLDHLRAEKGEEIDIIDHELAERRAERLADLEEQLKSLEADNAKERDMRAAERDAERDLEALDEEAALERDLVESAFSALEGIRERTIIEDEDLWRELVDRYGQYFDGGMGAEAIADLMANMDFDKEEAELRAAIEASDGRKPLPAQRKQKAIKRLKILSAFNRRDEHGRRINDPRAMILDVVPCIPPDLRPMVQLDGGRFATSDLNDLYRRVINRNNRLKRLLDIKAPEIIVNNEKRMLQEAVDALFDNGRRGRPVTGPGGRALKSLSDMLKGKQGRFRQNLLGKRVDYSGRSVIVAGPTLRLHQCGLPKLMALELFKPFVMKRLVDSEIAQNIKSAKRMVERRRADVWDVLEDVIKEHPVLLNRAPTLHRLGIQAFEPLLVEGKAVQIHPLVCAAFNADFDGDQMAVHLPLSSEAQAEARVLMLSANNILSPADGRPMTVPSQDLLIGSYYLTELRDSDDSSDDSSVADVANGLNGHAGRAGHAGQGLRPVFRHLHQIEQALELGQVRLQQQIEWRTPRLSDGNGGYEPTTPGRALFNATLPDDFEFVNRPVRKNDMGTIVRALSDNYATSEISVSLDRMKDLCYAYASRSGLTISVDDVRTPPDKAEILERHEGEAQRVETQFRRGIITDGERRQKEVEIWTDATDEVRRSLEAELARSTFNPIDMMVGSGARGNMMQVRQIAAIRGLVANPRGDIIPRPIKSSYREGLATLEYFISTPGARKGLVDTALRTADSGYLTRRLVDVAQELIVNNENPFERPGPTAGLWIEDVFADRPDKRTHLDTRLFSRCLAADVTLSDGTVLEAGRLIGEDEMIALRDDPEITRVRVLSPLTDESEFGVSAMAYGGSLATGKLIEVGEAVGVIAAQSIGEPGTQLTMRTFHTGGVIGGENIAGGLPRVVELFEARTPRGKAVLARRSGVVRIGEDDGRGRQIDVIGDDGSEDTYMVPSISRLAVLDGHDIRAGDPLVDGPRDPKELIEIRGVRETQQYLVSEVQRVYREQGVSIHDKHIELIVRQMTRRVYVGEQGDSPFLPGEQVDQRNYREANRQLVAENRRPAQGRPIIMGITKASLATESWLSAASFQETTRVLTEAAIESRLDYLKGLKENIIIGKLIPAGTGQTLYRNIDTVAPDYEPMEFWSSEDDQDPAVWLASANDGAGLRDAALQRNAPSIVDAS